MTDIVMYNHATAPAPTITYTSGKPRVLLTGVVFRWSGQCALCRKTIDLYAEDGQILIEIQASKARKTVRWRREDRAKLPTVPKACPACGKERWRCWGTFDRPTSSSPGYVGNAVSEEMNTAYAKLRADFPALAEPADEALQQHKTHYGTVVIR